MLLLLDSPRLLLAVAIALLVAVVAHSVVQATVAAALGDRRPEAAGRRSLDPRRHVDAFGVIAMLLAGLGWQRPLPLQEPRLRSQRGRFTLIVLSGPATNLAIGTMFLLVAGLIGGRSFDPDALVDVLLVQMAVVNVAVGVLTLVPLPPLDGARLLWVYAPATEGWRRARYHLEEQNIGLALCLGLLLPLFGSRGLLDRVVWAVATPLIEAIGSLVGLS